MGERKWDLVAKVPQVTLLFWIIKILATTLGETGGDAVTMSWLGENTSEAKATGYLIGLQAPVWCDAQPGATLTLEIRWVDGLGAPLPGPLRWHCSTSDRRLGQSTNSFAIRREDGRVP